MNRICRMIIPVACTAGFLILGLSCSKKPTKPSEPPRLRLFLGDARTNNLYAYDLETDSVLDSIGNMFPIDMVLSDDGKWLYVTHYLHEVNQGTAKINTATFEIVATQPDWGWNQAFVDDDRLLIRQNPGCLDFIDPVSFELLDRDSTSLNAIAATDAANYLIGWNSKRGLVTYDYKQKKIILADSLHYSAAGFLTFHPSGNAGFGIFSGPMHSGWFVAFSTPDLEHKYSFHLEKNSGTCRVTPDGEYVLITDSWNMFDGVTGNLYVYYVAANKVIETIRTDTLALTDSFAAALTQIEFSQDGSLAYIATGGRGAIPGPVLIFEIETLSFIDRIDLWPESETVISDIAVGLVPE
jgi:hypothetical protein